MGNDNKVDLTKLTKSQSTGKSISERFSHSVKVAINNAMCPQGRSKLELLELESAKSFYNDSWQREWEGYDSYILFNSPSGNHIVLAVGLEYVLSLANLHLGGDFEKQNISRKHLSKLEKKLLSDVAHKIVTQIASNYRVVEFWSESLHSSHVEMIHKKISNKKYFEARFIFKSIHQLDSKGVDLMLGCLFTKQNPMG
jgi:flagellar motor switch protein FliM